MGSNTSKPNNDTVVQLQKNDSEKDIGGNPDPRSPTPEITRTPLQNKNGGKHNITKNVDLRKTFENGKTEEKLVHNNPILSAVIKNHLQSYDPRSPTQDFERTPIVIGHLDESVDKQILREQIVNDCGSPSLTNTTIENNNHNDSIDTNLNPEQILPKNLCNGFYDMTLNDSLKEPEEPLGSSTASNEAIEGNISKEIETKPSKLLETNFDFIDGTQDKVEDSSDEPALENAIPDIEIKNVPLFKILDDDPRSPSLGIERTPIIVAKIEENSNEENVEKMSDDTLIKVLQNTNAELRQNVAQEKNDGILIYEDETNHVTLDTPKKSKSTSNSGSRTPLSCMKNKNDASHTRSKSANMLYDPNNTKQNRRVSHIPRLKSLNKQAKYFQTGSTMSLKNITNSAISGDCENTPPQSHRDRWDKESSIVL